ncbi:hypothetical protein BRADI_1g70942v3 [Brachypodium distachyon]|uniref:MADS-box domain-containing protein n=1 Tax=Brachypodium distachyon TaxID=15368 RepID=A0A0Q3HK22_BRADI|nr:hypothetical protein BRADI_1g70942v3 [Brachypodium distachyon]
MGRGKTPMGLIGDRRKRAAALASRKRGLMKMASELSTLCNVPVAVVVLGGGPVVDGAPPHHRPPLPEVWESEQGVVERYRALPAEKRAEHTHLRYLEGNLGKEKAKLARVLLRGPAALAQPDAELNGMSLHELRALLESLDAALLATAERKKEIGLPEHDDYYGAVDVAGGAPCTGGGVYYEMEEPDHQAATREDANAMNVMRPGYYCGVPNMNVRQPAYDARGFMLDMAPVIAHPAYGGFQYTDGYDAGRSSSQMQIPSNFNDNLAMWHTAEQCNAVVPADWYTDLFADDNSLYTAPGCLGMGGGGDAMNYVDCNDMQYCSSNDLQWSGTSTGQNSWNIDGLHYLRAPAILDVVDGRRNELMFATPPPMVAEQIFPADEKGDMG